MGSQRVRLALALATILLTLLGQAGEELFSR